MTDFKFKATAALMLAVLVAVGFVIGAGEPRIQYQQSRSEGLTTTFVGASGTNTQIEIDNQADVALPFSLVDVSATVDGVATSSKCYRVWDYRETHRQREIITNFVGNLETNYWDRYVNTRVTNLVYDSATDTLPVSDVIAPFDDLLWDFGAVTNVLLRFHGKSE